MYICICKHYPLLYFFKWFCQWCRTRSCIYYILITVQPDLPTRHVTAGETCWRLRPEVPTDMNPENSRQTSGSHTPHCWRRETSWPGWCLKTNRQIRQHAASPGPRSRKWPAGKRTAPAEVTGTPQKDTVHFIPEPRPFWGRLEQGSGDLFIVLKSAPFRYNHNETKSQKLTNKDPWMIALLSGHVVVIRAFQDPSVHRVCTLCAPSTEAPPTSCPT